MSGQAVLNGVHKIRAGASHVGLMLEKLSDVPEKEEHAKALLDYALGAKPSDDDAKHQRDAIARHRKALESIGATCWTRTTASSLALHLAKAGIFENKGVSFHRCLGFAVIPGTGLKGMARAWAKQSGATEEMLLRVFGTERPEGKGAIEEGQDRAGRVVFHDAWPVVVPKLQIDLLASHHPDYYAGKGAPGDWEGPKMVSFLTVEEGSRFTFAISGLSPDEDPAILAQAREWLDAALTYLGAGAKTNAGYGLFNPIPDNAKSKRLGADVSLKLITPAFLAGAAQKEADCNLRGSTLRGMLRWWWRTRHADHLNVSQLKALEDAVWGSSKIGGAVSVSLTASKVVQRAEFKRGSLREIGHTKNEEVSHRERSKLLPAQPRRAGLTDPQKIAPGLLYVSYGMDEESKGTRYCLDAGASWEISIRVRSVARSVDKKGVQLTPELPDHLILQEVLDALWLLGQFGGVGSKGRKGFGSLHVEGREISSLDLQAVRRNAESLRQHLEKSDPGFLQSRQGEFGGTPSIAEGKFLSAEVPSKWAKPLDVLNQVGASLQFFASIHAHIDDKKALGLPRNVKTTVRSFTPARPVGDRHSSPWHVSLHPAADGTLVVRYIAFPSAVLPNRNESEKWLRRQMEHLSADLADRFKTIRPRNISFPLVHPTAQATTAVELRPGSVVECTLSEEKTKKGGWKAFPAADPTRVGPITNSVDIPGDKSAGESVKLVINSISPEITFRWPKAGELEQKPQAKPSAAKPHPPYGRSR